MITALESLPPRVPFVLQCVRHQHQRIAQNWPANEQFPRDHSLYEWENRKTDAHYITGALRTLILFNILKFLRYGNYPALARW